MDRALQSRITDALRQVSAHDLQVLAEEMACVKFPKRFLIPSLVRAGRNSESQTTKGWPDAYAVTGNGSVDGIEATREKQSWKKHLQTDLEKAIDPKYPNLSGYFFVGGYPTHAPTADEIRAWTETIASQAAIQPSAVSILIGDDLVQELMQPQYARIRQELLAIPAETQWFQLLGTIAILDSNLGTFQPSREEFENGQVTPPGLIDDVLSDLKLNGYCHVTGYGAAGKTTLAQLVAITASYKPNPSWYLNISQFEPGALTASLNEMIELAGEGILFVVDNVHIDEAFAQRAYVSWEKSGKPLGSKLLLLGRQTSNIKLGRFGTEPSRLLRASFGEMTSVVTRLCLRRNKPIPKLSSEVLGAWANTFGGSPNQDETAVDLIAFAAALEQQLDRVSRGDFTLRADDAVDGVQGRYLLPLKSTGEFANLFRLAALSEFEIGLPDELLVDRVDGFRRSKGQLGIVVEERTGLEGRRMHKLVHAALGDLLIKANGDFSVLSERVAISRESPAIGMRMMAEQRGINEIETVLKAAVVAGDWITRTHNIYDLANVIRGSLQKRWATSAALDHDLVRNGNIQKIVEATRDLPGVAAFVGLGTKRNFPLGLAAILKLAKSQSSKLAKVILSSNVREVVRLLRELPDGMEILPTIEEIAWSAAQRNVPSDGATNTVAATRFLELHGRADLAVAPCAQLVRSRDIGLWNPHADLGHLSHSIRRSGCEIEEITGLVRFLSKQRWMQTAALRGGIGQLCGALMSFANNLPVELRSDILVVELAHRIRLSVQKVRKQNPWEAARTVCLIGAYSALGGRLPDDVSFAWEKTVDIEEMLKTIVPEKDKRIFGMYELQFWLGLKALNELNLVASNIDPQSKSRFSLILQSSKAPTKQAATIKEHLLLWLDMQD